MSIRRKRSGQFDVSFGKQNTPWNTFGILFLYLRKVNVGFMMAKLSPVKKRKKRTREGKRLKDRVLDIREIDRRKQTGSKH